MSNVSGELEITKTDTGQVIVACWPRMLTVEQAAAYLGLSPKTIRNHRYRLPGMRKVVGKVVFDRQAIDRSRGQYGGRRGVGRVGGRGGLAFALRGSERRAWPEADRGGARSPPRIEIRWGAVVRPQQL